MLYIWQLSDRIEFSWAIDKLKSTLNTQLNLANQLFQRQEDSAVFALSPKILVGWAGSFPSRFLLEAGKDKFLIYGCVEGLSLQEKDLRDFFALVRRVPQSLKNYSGKFLVAHSSADTNQGFLATSVSECLSLWTAEGEQGRVFGWRPGPTLDLCGLSRKLDLQTSELYLSLGWQASRHSHYQRCQRLTSRTFIRLDSQKMSSPSIYIKLGELFSNDERTLSNEDCAEFLIQRIQTQLASSSHPLIYLSGGRDSRMIAAAAVRAGYNGIFTTAEKDNLVDAQVAQIVAEKLGRGVEVLSGIKNRSDLVRPNIDRILAWTRLNESLEALRHTVRYSQVCGGTEPTGYREIFHGFGGEHMRGFVYNHDPFFQRYPLRLAKRRFLELVASAPLSNQNEYFDESMKEWLDEFEGSELSGYQFLDIVYWQNRTLFWAEDGNSVKFLFSQRWNPLLDYRLMKAVWNRPHLYKASSRFSFDVTKILAPQLADVPYDETLGFVGFARRKAKLVLRNSSLFHSVRGLRSRLRAANAINQAAGSVPVWKTFFFHEFKAVWPRIISPRELNHIIEKDGDSEVLWHLAALEVFHHACIENHQTTSESIPTSAAALST